jgi:hypothetical protein
MGRSLAADHVNKVLEVLAGGRIANPGLLRLGAAPAICTHSIPRTVHLRVDLPKVN